MKYILPLLFLVGCGTIRAKYLKFEGIDWACTHNTKRMNCININEPSRINPNFNDPRSR